jgi:hypothetical protein
MSEAGWVVWAKRKHVLIGGGGLLGAIAIAFLFFPSPKRSAVLDPKELACEHAALQDYVDTSQKTLGHLQVTDVLESTIARRRLEENYCLLIARCEVGDVSNNDRKLDFGLAFDTCLQEEENERRELSR